MNTYTGVLVALVVVCFPVLSRAGNFANSSQAYDDCIRQANLSAATITAPNKVTFVGCTPQVSDSCWNTHVTYTDQVGTGHQSNAPDVACYTTNSCLAHTVNNEAGHYVTSSSFLSTGATVCNHGCKATFSPQSGPSGIQVPGQAAYNYGSTTDTGAFCDGTEGGGGGGAGVTGTGGSGGPPCKGNQCFNGGAGGPAICTAGAGCASTPGPGPTSSNNCKYGNPSINSGARYAECVGNPAPAPNKGGDSDGGGQPNEGTGDGQGGNGVDSSCKGTEEDFSFNGSTVHGVDYGPCGAPQDGTCDAGQVQSSSGCVDQCSNGQIWDGSGCRDGCGVGQTDRGNGCENVCDPSQVLVGTKCQDSCGTGQVPNGTGGCQFSCLSGTLWDTASGQCKGNCAAGTYASGGTCVSTCPTGTTTNGANLTCDPGCANGNVEWNGACVAKCPDGTTSEVGDGAATGSQARCVANNTDTGGTDCKTAPACSGDQILCNVDFQNWKTRCALEGSKSPDATDSGESTDPANGSAAIASETTGDDPMNHLNGSGWLGGTDGSCPTLPSPEFMGKTFALADYIPCSALNILGLLIVFGAYAQAAYIVGRSAV